MTNNTPPRKQPIEAGMHFEKSEKQLYITIPTQVTYGTFPTYDQEVVRSDGSVYVCSLEERASFVANPSEPDIPVRDFAPMTIEGRRLRVRMTVAEVKHELANPPFMDDMLATDLVAELKKHVHLEEEWQYHAVAVWCAGTHLYKAFNKYPFLHLTSKEAGSGKTTLLAFVNEVARTPERLTGFTDAALIDIASSTASTILIDEFEKLGRKAIEDGKTKEVLNSFFDVDSVYRKREYVKDLKRWVTRDYSLFSPTVVCKLMAGGIPGTIRDRSLTILLKRLSTATQQAQLSDPRDNPRLAALNVELTAWALRVAADVHDWARQNSYTGIGLNRRRDLWNILLSTAKFLSDDSHAILLATAQAPEPTFEDDTYPDNLTPVVAFLDECRVRGKDKVKVTDVITNLGTKLCATLQSTRALVPALEPFSELFRIQVKNHGPGGTKHIFLN